MNQQQTHQRWTPPIPTSSSPTSLQVLVLSENHIGVEQTVSYNYKQSNSWRVHSCHPSHWCSFLCRSICSHSSCFKLYTEDFFCIWLILLEEDGCPILLSGQLHRLKIRRLLTFFQKTSPVTLCGLYVAHPELKSLSGIYLWSSVSIFTISGDSVLLWKNSNKLHVPSLQFGRNFWFYVIKKNPNISKWNRVKTLWNA